MGRKASIFKSVGIGDFFQGVCCDVLSQVLLRRQGRWGVETATGFDAFNFDSGKTLRRHILSKVPKWHISVIEGLGFVRGYAIPRLISTTPCDCRTCLLMKSATEPKPALASSGVPTNTDH
jgi:hypothetical protein